MFLLLNINHKVAYCGFKLFAGKLDYYLIVKAFKEYNILSFKNKRNVCKMALSYVDFIAPNVEVCVKYCVDGKFRWFDGSVLRVLERYVDADDDTECVTCIVSFENDRYTETFKEIHYNSDDDDAWCFGDKFVQLVEQVKYLTEDVTPVGSDDDNTDEEYSPATDESQSDEDDDADEDNDDETEEEYEDDENTQPIRKRKYSFANNVGAALFMLSPWIASALVLFNARREIMQHLRLV